MAPLLEITGLKAVIRTDEGIARVLDHIDLAVAPGRILGVVGESGCGKSTLVRAILGILPDGATIERGSIRFAGEELIGMPEAELNRRIRGSRIGFVPQDPYLALNPVFPVGRQFLEIMRWHAATGSRREHRARLVELLRRVQLPDPEAALDRAPHQFSGGQRQRLVIAAALACAPALVIADEPTTALDVTTQRQIVDLLRDLAAEFDLAMLFVTHDLGVVAELCDDVCVIYAGQTVETGPTRSVFAAPRHPYTRALLACHPDRSDRFIGIAGSVPSPLNAAPGCRFAPRCGDARADCARRVPLLVAQPDGSRVDCLLYAPAEMAAQ